MPTYWLSFASEKPPARVVLVDAESEDAASRKGHALGIYQPGDQTLIIEIPPKEAEYFLPRDRVVTQDELAAVGAMLLGDVDRTLS